MAEVKKFSKVLNRLENKVDFPLDPNEIGEILTGCTPIECFRFIGVDIDEKILKGGFVRSELRVSLPSLYGEALNIGYIFYSLNLSKSWERFCIIKEMMHAIDPIDVSTITKPEHLISLIDHLSLSREVLYAKFMKGITPESIKPLVDTMGDWRALLVMVPEKEREKILKQYQDGNISYDEIAEYFEIPKTYVNAILTNDFWDFITTLWHGLDNALDSDHHKLSAA